MPRRLARSWTRLANVGVTESQPEWLARRIRLANVLSSTFAAITVPCVAMLYAVVGPRLGLPAMLVVIGYLATVWLNRAGRLDASRLTFVAVLNSSIFLYCLVFGKEAGIRIFFLVAVGVPLVIFTRAERLKKAVCLVVPILLELVADAWGDRVGPGITLAPGALAFLNHANFLIITLTFTASYVLVSNFGERAERRLMESEAQLRSILECAEDGILLLDRAGRCIAASKSFDAATAPDAGLQRQVLATGQSVRVERRLRRSDGSFAWYATVLSPVTGAGGEVKAMVAVARDISAMKRREAELEEARKTADTANRAKSEFLATMNHEIRTPLGVIIGFAELLETGRREPLAAPGMIEAISRNGRHLMRIVDEILDLSKVESGQLTLEPLPVFLEQTIRDVFLQFEKAATKKALEFTVSFAGDLPKVVVIDPTRFRQILVNLIGNSLKFTAQGFVRVAAGWQERQDGRRLTVVVADSGEGITPEFRGKLFQSFSQGDPSTTRRFGGTGLGLALSRSYALAMGGDIELTQTTPREGSTFTVLLPHREGEARIAEAAASARLATARASRRRPASGSSLPLAGLPMLVVEDNADNRELITHYLVEAGARVATADDGQSGIEKALREPFAAILMDLQMPVVDGLQATAALRLAGLRGPIIALTAYATKADREACLAGGFTAFLSKPIVRDALIELVWEQVFHLGS